MLGAVRRWGWELMLQTREQVWAGDCWGVLTPTERFGSEPGEWKDKDGAKKYLGTLKKTTSRIYVSGLGQAVAFVLARNEPGDMEFNAIEDLSQLVLRCMNVEPADNHGASLIRTIREGDQFTLMQATDEALGIITWLTRYLEGAGVQPDDIGEGDDQDG